VSYSILRALTQSRGDSPKVTDGPHRHDPTHHGGYPTGANLDLHHLPPPGSLWAKLAISHVGDPTETQADRIADQVMQPETDAGPGSATRSGSEPRQDGRIERSPLPAGTTESPQSASSVPDGFIGGLGPGQPMDPVARTFFEPRFGRDLSDVRLHTSAAAAQAASAVHAKAFTVGPHIAFAADYGGAHTDGGKRLLAHEIAHVVQQGNRRTPGTQGAGHRLDRRVTIDTPGWGGSSSGWWPGHDDSAVSFEPWARFDPEGSSPTVYAIVTGQVVIADMANGEGTIKIKAGSKGDLKIKVKTDVFINNKLPFHNQDIYQNFEGWWHVETDLRGHLKIERVGEGQIYPPDDDAPPFSLNSVNPREGTDWVTVSPIFVSSTASDVPTSIQGGGTIPLGKGGIQGGINWTPGQQRSYPPGLVNPTFRLYIKVTDTVPEPEPHGKVAIGPIIATKEHRVYFKIGRSDVTPSERDRLAEWYFRWLSKETRERLKQDLKNPEKKLELEGYASDTGSTGKNFDLAAQRAAQVKKILERFGVKDPVDSALGEYQEPGATGEEPSWGKEDIKETEDAERRTVVIRVWDQIFAGEAPAGGGWPGEGP
jgi:hypothetical protein